MRWNEDKGAYERTELTEHPDYGTWTTDEEGPPSGREKPLPTFEERRERARRRRRAGGTRRALRVRFPTPWWTRRSCTPPIGHRCSSLSMMHTATFTLFQFWVAVASDRDVGAVLGSAPGHSPWRRSQCR